MKPVSETEKIMNVLCNGETLAILFSLITWGADHKKNINFL
jgi:hypothetical protein